MTCQFPEGLSAGCERRFALGINYAWHHFAGDFGGIVTWDQGGVSAESATVSAELAQLSANGVTAVRWWMFPDFRGNGVVFDGSGDPSGISEGARADVAKALELAAAHDLYIVFTIFSFDNFRPDAVNSGITVRGMSPMVSNAARRTKLVENVVRQVARAAGTSAHADRLLGWDVINEPEWAINPTGSAPQYRDFTPNDELTAVGLADMKALLNESLAVLKAETPNAQRSVGWASVKWSWAFADVTDLEFNQPHIYGWANADWPYTLLPNELGYPDRPTLYGEFGLASMPFADGDDATFSQVLGFWFDNGYAGAWPWQFAGGGASQLPLIQSFAAQKGCQVRF
jgi:hypothetical protein